MLIPRSSCAPRRRRSQPVRVHVLAHLAADAVEDLGRRFKGARRRRTDRDKATRGGEDLGVAYGAAGLRLPRRAALQAGVQVAARSAPGNPYTDGDGPAIALQ